MTLFAVFALVTASTTPTDASTTIGHADWNVVAAAARRMDLPASTLYQALAAREVPRRDPRQVRYCVRRGDIVAGKSGMVCRTEAQWAALGIDITASRG